jgi:hypothetical protein
MSNRFPTLEILDMRLYIDRAWETIREDSRISAKESLGYYELQKHISHGSTKDAQNY